MKIIISPDSFKGTLTALEAAKSIEAGIHHVDPTVETVVIPVADGGEGTVDTLVLATNGRYVEAAVTDPLGRPITAQYGVLGDGQTCVIEMAAASGITLLHNNERNPRIASTFGTGQLLKHALDQGFTNFIMCIGGSATNDGGVGMLRALGLQLLDEHRQHVQKSIDGLYDVAHFDFSNWDPRLQHCTFTIACDVDNPFVGETGASAIFGPQKGVDDVAYFDGALTHFANVVAREMNVRLHDYKGAGAAGGMGGALIAFLNGAFHQGIDLVLDVMRYSEKIKGADLIITGEGKSDAQTLHGKAPVGVLHYAANDHIPVMLLSGAIDDEDRSSLQQHFTHIASVVGDDITVDMAMHEPSRYVTLRTEQYMKQLLQKGV
ncbi:MAG: glycerate kinase [Caryophanon sp.]|nr:glycerate kinase [Caryophanon sp.]